MLHSCVQKDYISWLENVVVDPFLFLPQFCDWLDENNIRSQKYREILSILDKAIFLRHFGGVVFFVTKQRYVSISVIGKNKKIWLRMTKRKSHMTDDYFKKMKFKDLRRNTDDSV
jgi:hypothetical protein